MSATAPRMGIRTVAVYSDADATRATSRPADEAVRIGPAPARESATCAATRSSRPRAARAPQAIHPGYGFLSENAASREPARTPASSSSARRRGDRGDGQQVGREGADGEGAACRWCPAITAPTRTRRYLRGEADAIGYPVLIKASAGGGGKGMRIVSRVGGLRRGARVVRSAKPRARLRRRRVLIETLRRSGRATSRSRSSRDTHGNCVYLFERDCSVQRRHQKVIEEAPAPGMTPARRARDGRGGGAAARAIGYVGAGTVEFIADTRRHLLLHGDEHAPAGRAPGDRDDHRPRPGRVAAARRRRRAAAAASRRSSRSAATRSRRASTPRIRTRASCRRPARCAICDRPRRRVRVAARAGEPHVRIDSGVREGDAITPYYDPMIAKLIVWGRDRDQAIAPAARTRSASSRSSGVTTNVDFLQRRWPPRLRGRRPRHRTDRARARRAAAVGERSLGQAAGARRRRGAGDRAGRRGRAAHAARRPLVAAQRLALRRLARAHAAVQPGRFERGGDASSTRRPVSPCTPRGRRSASRGCATIGSRTG